MGKHLPTFLKALVGLLFLAGFCLYLFRQPILDALLDSQLTRLRVPHSLTVEQVSLNGLVLRNISLGAANELRSEEIRIGWALQDLLKGELQTIEISGLQLSLDLSGEKPPLGSLQKLLKDEGDSGDNKFPQVSLINSKLDLHTGIDDFTINLDGNIKQGSSGEQLIAMTFVADATQGHAKGNLDATLDVSGKISGILNVSEGAISLASANISGIKGNSSFSLINNKPEKIMAEFVLSDISLPSTGLEDGALDQAGFTLQMDTQNAKIKGNLMGVDSTPILSFDATIQDYLQQPLFAANATIKASAVNNVWSLFGLPQPAAGFATARIRVDGQIPGLNKINDYWLQRSTLKGDAELTLNGLGYAQKITAINGNITFTGKLEDGMGKLILNETSMIEASGLNPDWLKNLGLPDDLSANLKQDAQLRVTTKGENTASVKFNKNVDEIELNLTTNIAINTEKAKVIISTLAEAKRNAKNRLTTFKLSDIAVNSSGINYAGNKFNHLNLAGSIQGKADDWAGDLDLIAEASRFRYDLLDARQMKTKLPLKLKFNNSAWYISLHKPGQISFGKLAPVESVRLQGPLTFHLTNADIKFSSTAHGLAFKHQINIRPNNFTLHVNRSDAPALKLKIRPGKIKLYGGKENDKPYKGKSIINAAGITLPQYRVQLDKIATTIRLGVSTGKLADFKIGRLQHLATKPVFAPVSLSGSAKLERKQLIVNTRGGIAGTKSLKITAIHGLDSGSGKLNIVFDPLVFSPDALQPSVLFPDLAVLENVSGKVSASSNFNWSKKGISSSGKFDFLNLSFVQGGASVTGLSAALELTDLLSPKSLAQQKINIQRIDLGVPMEDIEVTYQMQENDSPKIAIDKAGLNVLGGALSIGPTLIDPSSSRSNMLIHVADLDLAKLFELIKVEGLAGNGRLDGSVPIIFKDGLVSIQNGKLIANKPGILYFKSETASKLLAGRADDIDLLLQALTEFHYTELTLKLNNSTNNDLVATLSLLGKNPNVLKGRLFRLNINLESNIGNILKAVAQGYGLSNKALQRALRLQKK